MRSPESVCRRRGARGGHSAKMTSFCGARLGTRQLLIAGVRGAVGSK